VLSGDRRIEERDLAIIGATDDRDAERQIEFLEQEP
jgi:hypothetical protein